jgi:hypothetical protein
MGVIINLKEIFAADGQEIFTDKVNFNFNKLLELGIGDQGIQGIQGPVGSAGPPGIQGDIGERGNKWFVGVGNPNGQTFADLILGDFFLETNDSSIWQYQGPPAIWIQVADLSEIIISILEDEGSPFIRGFGEASPLDNRFITFTKRGNDIADILADTVLGNPANNDILLLTNWNERVTTIDNFPISINSEFNAIQSISVNHTATSLGRYHLEFSSLNTISGQTELSSLNHNLKIRYLKNPTISSTYPVSNQLINVGRFSMSIPEAVVPTQIDEQGIFEFITPKYQDAADGSPIKENMTFRIGSSEPLSETSLTDLAVDGIDISVDLKAINFGLIRELETFTSIQTLPFGLSGEFGMINISNLVTGMMIKGDTYHTDSLNTIHIDSKYGANSNIESPAPLIIADSTAQGYQGIFSDGKYLMVASPRAGASEALLTAGQVRIYDIQDPDSPKLFTSASKGSFWTVILPGSISYDIHGNPVGNGLAPGYLGSRGYFDTRGPGLTGVRDISYAGKYGVLVRRKPIVPGTSPAVGDVRYVDTFLVFELDSDAQALKVVSALGTSAVFADFMAGSAFQGGPIPELDKARRVKISGNWAYVITDSETIVDPSYLIAVDITNPARPYIDSEYIDTSLGGSRHIDFDIEGEVAYILTSSGTAPNNLNIKKVSIFDPTGLSTSPYTLDTTIATRLIGNHLTLGSIKVEGSRIFVVNENKLYIYNTGASVMDTPLLISSTNLPAGYEASDIEVSGKFAYIYTEDTLVNRSTILTYDISDETTPLLLEPLETFSPGVGNGKPSKMTMVGDRIFTVAASNGGDSLAGINSVKIAGINSPAAKIGNIHSKDVKVSNSVSVGETLQVGRSATIGSGGLWVDTGEGVNTNLLKINMNNNDPIQTIFETRPGIFIKAKGWTSPSTSPASVLVGSAVFFEEINQSSTLLGIVTGSSIAIVDSLVDQVNLIAINISNTEVSTGSAKGITSQFTNLNMLGNDDVIGLDFNFNTITTTGDVIGIDISGEDFNRLSGDLEVGGNVDIASDLDVGGNVDIASDLDVGGDANITGDLNIDGQFYNAGDSLSSIVVDAQYDVATNGIDANVISSGRYRIEGTIGNGFEPGLDHDLHWIRVGRIVHCHFRVKLDSLDTNGNTIPLPTFGHNIGLVEGHGHIDNTGTPSGDATASTFQFYVGVANLGSTLNPFPAVRCFYRSNGAEVGENVTNENGSVLRGSFSYLINAVV